MGLGNSCLESLLLFFGESQRLGLFLVDDRFGVSVTPARTKERQPNCNGTQNMAYVKKLLDALDVRRQQAKLCLHLERILGRELCHLGLGPQFGSPE